MSNAVELHAKDTPAVSVFANEGNDFNTTVRLARALAESTVMPKEYQGNIANCMVAMEYAHRLGASVLAVAQNLDVIQGRPSLRATFLIGTVNASGRFSPIRWRFQGEEGTDTWGCRAVATERDSGEVCEGPLITIKLAKDEGWFSKAGSKWKTTPELMLRYRSAAWWTRLYAPEMSLGLYTSDEVVDAGPPPAARVQIAARALDRGDDPPPSNDEADLLTDSIIEFVHSCQPHGGDATPRQRERIEEIAGRVAEDGGFLHAGLLSLARHPDLGKSQAGALVGKLKLLIAALYPEEKQEPETAGAQA